MIDPIVALLSHRYDFPEHLEFDTFDYCNLNCRFCYLHNTREESNRLPLHLVERLLQQTVGRKFQSIRPWMNGDPLFENRLPKIIEIIRKYNYSPIHMFTNGTNYDNRHLLTNPEISEVHFTISAATSKTYALVLYTSRLSELSNGLNATSIRIKKSSSNSSSPNRTFINLKTGNASLLGSIKLSLRFTGTSGTVSLPTTSSSTPLN